MAGESRDEGTTIRTAVFVGVLVLVVTVAAIGSYYSTGTGPAGTWYFFLPSSSWNSSVSIQVGQYFVFQLNSSAASTGYDWNVSTSSGIRYLGYTVVPTSSMPGRPQVRNYLFQAVQTGEQQVVLQDMRLFAPYDVAATIVMEVGVAPQPEILSYNFQFNGSGSLSVVLKNYGESDLSVSTVYLDGVPFAGSSLLMDSGCYGFTRGVKCGITLTFGPGHEPPAYGTSNTLELVTTSGSELYYALTAGELYHAGCTYTSSC